MLRQEKLARGIQLLIEAMKDKNFHRSRYINLGEGIGVKTGFYKDTDAFYEASIEANCQVQARRRLAGLDIYVPDVFGIVGVLFPCGWDTVIFMEHIDGKEGYSVDLPDYEGFKQRMNKLMRRVGVAHEDFHNGNWMIREDGKAVVIDWQYVNVGRWKWTGPNRDRVAPPDAVRPYEFERHEENIAWKRKWRPLKKAG
jgi:hypothetical protein